MDKMVHRQNGIGQNDIGQNGTDKMVGINGTDEIINQFINLSLSLTI